MKLIKTFAINLKKRPDRRKHIMQEFKLKSEFDFSLAEAVEHKNGAIGLWKTIRNIVANESCSSLEYIIISEDDHEFTTPYNKEALFRAIEEAKEKNADVLMGGVSWFSDAVQVSSNLFWVDQFTGTQFVVVYKKFFDKIINTHFNQGDTADRKIAELTVNKFMMYPFISIQKEFGYSDATTKNNVDGYVTQIFDKTSEKLVHLVKVGSFYNLKF
ncbi:glycosyltransferase family 25 protein [Pedobacter nyackensis]|nr:glycosyl transferase [Pedobacter nyackensis]